VPRMCAEHELSAGHLRALRIKQMRVVRKLYLVYRRDRPLSAAAQAVVDLIRGRNRAESRERRSKPAE